MQLPAQQEPAPMWRERPVIRCMACKEAAVTGHGCGCSYTTHSCGACKGALLPGHTGSGCAAAQLRASSSVLAVSNTLMTCIGGRIGTSRQDNGARPCMSQSSTARASQCYHGSFCRTRKQQLWQTSEACLSAVVYVREERSDCHTPKRNVQVPCAGRELPSWTPQLSRQLTNSRMTVAAET